MDENLLKEAMTTIRRFAQHKGNEQCKAIFDTIDALYPGDMQPLVINVAKNKDATGYTFIINLPPGFAYRDFKKKEHYFADAAGGAVQIDKAGKAVFLHLMTSEIQREYPYIWDPEKHKKLYLPFPVGYSPKGFIAADFSKVYYILVAGHPGAGKSAWLHQVIMSILLARDCWVIIIDRKKLEYGYLKKHCMVVTSIKDARKVLKALAYEGSSLLDKRLEILERYDVREIVDLPGGVLKPVVLVVDELAELDDKECMEYLNRYVRLGRAPGLWGIAATQRPSAKLSEDWTETKALFPASACFHVRDATNSQMVLGNDRAAHIPNIPGRGIWQFDEELEFQGMYLPLKKAKKLLGEVPERSVNIIEQPPKRLPPR